MYVSTGSFIISGYSIFLFFLERFTTRFFASVLPVKTAQRDRCGKIVDLKPLLIQKEFHSFIDSALQLDINKSIKQLYNSHRYFVYLLLQLEQQRTSLTGNGSRVDQISNSIWLRYNTRVYFDPERKNYIPIRKHEYIIIRDGRKSSRIEFPPSI